MYIERVTFTSLPIKRFKPTRFLSFFGPEHSMCCVSKRIIYTDSLVENAIVAHIFLFLSFQWILAKNMQLNYENVHFVNHYYYCFTISKKEETKDESMKIDDSLNIVLFHFLFDSCVLWFIYRFPFISRQVSERMNATLYLSIRQHKKTVFSIFKFIYLLWQWSITISWA